MIQPDCFKCVHRFVYVLETNPASKIQICGADGWADGEDGAFELMEISQFDEAQCLLFKEK